MALLLARHACSMLCLPLQFTLTSDGYLNCSVAFPGSEARARPSIRLRARPKPGLRAYLSPYCSPAWDWNSILASERSRSGVLYCRHFSIKLFCAGFQWVTQALISARAALARTWLLI